jgi:hypothetical protein
MNALFALIMVAALADLLVAPHPAWWARAVAALVLFAIAGRLIARPAICPKCGQLLADRAAAYECDAEAHLRAHLPPLPRLPKMRT